MTTKYEIVSTGEEHRCGKFPTPDTFDQYIICECGILFRSDILTTYCEDKPYVYFWEKATQRQVNWSIHMERLDPSYKNFLKKNKKKWWQI